MKTIEARAVISGEDKTGSMFANIAKKFEGISKVAKSFEGIKPMAGWGAGFDKELAKLQVTGREMARIQREFQRFQTITPRFTASQFMGQFDAWKNKTLAGLREVRVAEAATARRGGVGLAAGMRFTAGALGIGSAAYLAQRGMHAAGTAGADNLREDARDYLAGLTEAETERLKAKAMEMSSKYRSIDAATLHERYRDTAMSMRSLNKSDQLSETIAQGTVVLQSLKGKDAAIEEGRKFFKALDTLGKNLDPKEVRELFGGYVKALGVEGADLNMGDLFQVAKMAKSAGPGLSNEFLMGIAPGLMQDMGSARFGTAMGSMMAQLVGGRATKAAKAAQAEYGLRDADGNFTGTRDLNNPFKYTLNKIIPELQKRGINPDDIPAVTDATNKMFSNQVVADLFTKMITQREQYLGKVAQYDKAPGLDAAAVLASKDAYVGLEGLNAQLRNLGATMTDPVMKDAGGFLDSMAKGVSNWAESIRTAREKFKTAGADTLLQMQREIDPAKRDELYSWAIQNFAGKDLAPISAEYNRPYLEEQKGKRAAETIAKLEAIGDRETILEKSGLGGAFAIAQRNKLNAARSALQPQLEELGYGPGWVPDRGTKSALTMESLDRALRAGGYSPQADVRVTAGDMNVNLKVEPGSELLRVVEQAKQLKTPLTATVNGGGGLTSPDAEPTR